MRHKAVKSSEYGRRERKTETIWSIVEACGIVEVDNMAAAGFGGIVSRTSGEDGGKRQETMVHEVTPSCCDDGYYCTVDDLTTLMV